MASGPDEKLYGVSREEWQAAYRSGISEFAATRVVVRTEGGLVRIAFGNAGPPVDEAGGTGSPVYSHAVMLTPGLAVELSRLLRDLLAQPNAPTKGPR